MAFAPVIIFFVEIEWAKAWMHSRCMDRDFQQQVNVCFISRVLLNQSFLYVKIHQDQAWSEHQTGG